MKLSLPRAAAAVAAIGPALRSARFKFWTTLILWPAVLAGAGAAQNFAVDWHQVTGGGGTATNASYAVSGTGGQPASSLVAGGTFAIQGGFWAFAAGLPAAGAPMLTIQNTPAGAVVLSWPAAFTGFILQGSASLAPPEWTVVAALPSPDGLSRTAVSDPGSGLHFFRLMKP